jgi:hypothetical protein
MAYSITNLTQDIEGILHGTTINQVTNFYGICNRAARKLLLDIDPQETIRIVQLPSTLYNGVFDYSAPSDLKGNKVIDIRPQVDRTSLDIWGQSYNQAFDVSKGTGLYDQFTVQWNTALKSLRIAAPFLVAPTPLNYATDVSTSNGTWSAGSSATNLTANNTNYVTGGGSLQFNLSAAGSTGYVENSTSQSQDLSSVVNQSTLFLYTYLPTGADITNLKLRWGSSASNYYEVTATQTQQSTAFQNGWNLIAFPWLGATVVGSPVSSTITYLRVTWTYNGNAQTGVLLNNIVSNLGSVMQIEYYSKYLFRSSAGVFQETVVADTDLVNLDTETYNLFVNLVAYFTVQQAQGIDALNFDGNFFISQYQQDLISYKTKYKSQAQKAKTVYYQQNNPNYGKYMPGFWRG